MITGWTASTIYLCFSSTPCSKQKSNQQESPNCHVYHFFASQNGFWQPKLYNQALNLQRGLNYNHIVCVLVCASVFVPLFT